MSGVPSSSWFPVITLLAGFASKWVFDWLSHKRVLAKEREARLAQVRTQMLERRITFQRQTLLDLQDALSKLGRATGAAAHQDRMAFRTTGQWQRQHLTDGWSDKFQEAQVAAQTLSVRVRDDLVRDLVSQMKTACVETLLCSGLEESDAAMIRAMNFHEQLNDRVGMILRSLDDDEAALAIL